MLQVNITRYFYLLVSNGNLTLVFHAQLVAIRTDELVTVVNMVRINKQEGNLTARPEECLGLPFVTFLNLFRGILISCINVNSQQREFLSEVFLKVGGILLLPPRYTPNLIIR